MPGFSAAIFDLDGTLLDTLEDLADSANEALAAAGYPQHPAAAYRTFVGEGMRVLMERIVPEEARQDRTGLERLLCCYQAAYEQRWRNRTRPYEGIEDMLHALAAAGIPLTILSNKAQRYTEKCVAHHLARHRFRHVFGQRDEVPRKPDPAGAHEIAALLGLPAGDIAFIGDTRTDMETAVAAGMAAIGVAWGFRPVRELEESGAREVVSHPGELVRLFR
jgi:phosphoglycolate phosphatase